MVHIKEVIVVEGKYDAIRLSGVTDAMIVQTDGFRIFRDKEKTALLQKLAKERGLLILTDSDEAGMVIRNHLLSVIPKEQLRQAYIPQIRGKERRKTAPSAEGLLGVEGMDNAVLTDILKNAATVSEHPRPAFLTKARMMEDGLSGAPDSAQRRRDFLKAVSLPANLSANRLMEIVGLTMTEDEYEAVISNIKKPSSAVCP